MTGLSCAVVVVNFNGRAFLNDCLKSILASNYEALDIVVVDNASTDGSFEHAQQSFGEVSEIRWIRNDRPRGPAVARNQGTRATDSDVVVFVDNDTEMEPNWLSELSQVFVRHPDVGAAQAKLLSAHDRRTFDYAGDRLGPLGFLVERAGMTVDDGGMDYDADILSGKGACLAVRRTAFDDIGGFDDSYFMYLEETDLCWRLWLRGWRVVFAHRAVVYHAFDTPAKRVQTSYRYEPHWVRYHGCRNYIRTNVKNLGMARLIRVLPAHVAVWAMIGAVFAVTGRRHEGALIFKGIGWVVRNRRAVWSARAEVQRTRMRSDRDLGRVLRARPPISFYVGKLRSYVDGTAFGMRMAE